jgi:ABC-type branched-subunit amino acid transport system substrate-binding protein
MKFLPSLLALCWVFAGVPAFGAPPIRIGVTTILSGPNADRGQSEQYGVELALNEINRSGGVLGRQMEASYADNSADPATGIAGARRLIEQQHVSVLLGALATPVTKAVMPIANAARMPFVIDISAGQEFVAAAGIGGFEYVFKTNPSELDIAMATIRWLKSQNVRSVAIVADDNAFSLANAHAMESAAAESGIAAVATQVIKSGATDIDDVVAKLAAPAPDRILTVLTSSSVAFLRAYEQSGGKIPLAGRIDFAVAATTLSPKFLASPEFEKASGISVFTPPVPEVAVFVRAYQDKYGIAPTQRAFFAYEATKLVADAIGRAGSDAPQAIQAALKASAMPSLSGGTFTMDKNNHAHTAMQIVGMRGGKLAVLQGAAK